MAYCSVNGLRIYYEVSGEGFPLLLVFSSNGRISDEGLSVLWRQRDPKRQLPIKPSDVVDWSFLPTKLE
jgi:hypothetical protein